jgi:hypothetical protein
MNQGQGSETHFIKKMTFLQGMQVLNKICDHLYKNDIDNIVFGKWAASLYTHELLNMGPFVLLISPVYLNEKKETLDKELLRIGFKASHDYKFIYEQGENRLIVESQSILHSENQLKRNTVWREFYEMTFQTRSASSILSDYEEAHKPEHEEIRKKLKAFIDSRKFVSRLANNINLDLSSSGSANSTSKKGISLPIDLINRLIQCIEESPYKTPLKPPDALAAILSSKNDAEDIIKLNAKRTLLFQAICERLNVQTYLLRFYDITNRFKSFACIEIFLNNNWYFVDLSIHQTTVIKAQIKENERYLNAVLKTRGTDCFEINLGEIEQEMQSEEQSSETIFLPKFSQE